MKDTIFFSDAHEPHPKVLFVPVTEESGSTTTERPQSTHPMDNPDWKAPLGPLDERDPRFWHNNGQDYLTQRLNTKSNHNVAKNLVIFIGDGMSLSTQMATRAYLGNENKYLSFERFPYTGLSRTYALNYQVPDSANTASAIFTGVKNNYGTVGVDGRVRLQNCTAAKEEQNHLKTIFRWAQEAEKATGFVTTTRITHATPAASYAISPDREFESDAWTPEGCTDIAQQLIYGETGKNFKVQLGGGSREFFPNTVEVHGKKGNREDGRFLLREWENERKNNGTAKYVLSRDELLKIDTTKTDYLLGTFQSSHLSYHLVSDKTAEPTLLEMTTKAIEILKKDANGFVLLVEGGLIDQGHHQNYAQIALEETVEFEKTIDYVKNVTKEEDTLLVVTADHSHVFTVGGYPERQNNILDIGDFAREDHLPFLTLNYANGMGYFNHFDQENGGRLNPDDMDTHAPLFRFPATVPLDLETHGGDDVGVFTVGPWADLFVGNYEESYLFHAMMYATCLGGDEYKKNPSCNSASSVTVSLFGVLISIFITFRHSIVQVFEL